MWYHMEFNGIDPESQKAKLIDTDEKFSQAVSEHFLYMCIKICSTMETPNNEAIIWKLIISATISRCLVQCII